MNYVFIFICLLFPAVSMQADEPFRVMFYNVENLFDTEDEPKKNDNEFTPKGFRYWTNKRYYAKLNNLAKVITSVGQWDTPALIGLCEVENDKVLNGLTTYSPLKKMEYRYILTESEDRRGIDVALLYQRNRFKYLYHQAIPIHFPGNKRKKTRDVLHVTGQVITGDTLDVFVCHFPSRRGGEMESEPDRVYVASVVREKSDSLMLVRRKANILIMGDFNDEPSDRSLSKTLKAKAIPSNPDKKDLYNLFLSIQETSAIGSYKYGRQWNFLDQIIVSGNLLNPGNRFHYLPESATIFQASFLLTEDKSYGGKRPKKTYHGRKYEGGYSDHLPVYADFRLKAK
ncbi:MAG: endonuclease [Candidatus Symbiothrix sp.]|jgi:endonuclease/exonuclease/phosphatase family metal-dependent hydrolase|nr:endonuclease [Candidatus Symbiothrix sp.]